MLKKVSLDQKVRAKDFLKFAPMAQQQRILEYVQALKGKKIVHVNATGQGGGVAEILQSFIPYLNAFGLRAEWYAIDADQPGKRFFEITDKIRNGLQGQAVEIKKEEWDVYENANREITKELESIACDILVVHDWQPAYAGFYLARSTPKVFVSHADTSSAYKPVADQIMEAMRGYDAMIFSNKDFVYPEFAEKTNIHVIAPAIDPLSLKQSTVPQKDARAYLVPFGVPGTGRFIVQVSRFDNWKNPQGVVEAFRIVQESHADVYLALVGIEEAQDNPDSKKVYEEVKGMVGDNPHISLFFSAKGIPHIAEFTMMAQNAADIVVQNSIKEGFGLTVTEAMWKEKPVVGGPASGVRLQITHGKNGFIAENTKDLAMYMDFLLSHPKERARVGKAAKESVRKRFLMPRFVLDHLKVYKELI